MSQSFPLLLQIQPNSRVQLQANRLCIRCIGGVNRTTALQQMRAGSSLQCGVQVGCVDDVKAARLHTRVGIRTTEHFGFAIAHPYRGGIRDRAQALAGLQRAIGLLEGAYLGRRHGGL